MGDFQTIGNVFTRMGYPPLPEGASNREIIKWSSECAAILRSRRPDDYIDSAPMMEPCPECRGNYVVEVIDHGDGWEEEVLCERCNLGYVQIRNGLYTCIRCYGEEFVRVGDKMAPCPSCSTDRRLYATLERARFPRKYERATMDYIKQLPDTKARGMDAAIAASRRIIEEMYNVKAGGRIGGKAWVYMNGEPSIGKSCLMAVALRNAVLMNSAARPRSFRWMFWPDRVSELQATFDKKGVSWVDEINDDCSVDLLCIDDFCADAKESLWRLELIHKLLELRAGKPTMITSMHSIGALVENYGSRIAERVFEESDIIDMRGESLRRPGHRAKLGRHIDRLRLDKGDDA